MNWEEIKRLLEESAPGTTITVFAVAVLGDGGAPSSHASSRAGAQPLPSRTSRSQKKTTMPVTPALETRIKPWTTAELAEHLSVTPETIQKWCRTGAFPGATSRKGLGWRIPPTAVRLFLTDSGRESGQPAAQASTGQPISPVDDGDAGERSPPGAPFDPAALSAWRAVHPDSRDATQPRASGRKPRRRDQDAHKREPGTPRER